MSQKHREMLHGLYVIIDHAVMSGRAEVEVARQAISGGARVIQLRDKTREKGLQLPVAEALAHLCRAAGVPFIVNDHSDLALAAGADGVHVGPMDLPVAVVRSLVPEDWIVGCSTNNTVEALQAQAAGASYVAVGRLSPTGSKMDTRPASLDTLCAIKAAVSVPVCAIGGIDESNVGQVIAAGADMIAVIAAVAAAPDVCEAAGRLAARFS